MRARQPHRIVTGRIIAGVTPTIVDGTGDWSVTRTAQGDYTLRFKPAFKQLLSIVVVVHPTPAGGLSFVVGLWDPGVTLTNESTVRISGQRSTTGAAEDTGFSFVAIGVGQV